MFSLYKFILVWLWKEWFCTCKSSSKLFL